MEVKKKKSERYRNYPQRRVHILPQTGNTLNCLQRRTSKSKKKMHLLIDILFVLCLIRRAQPRQSFLSP